MLILILMYNSMTITVHIITHTNSYRLLSGGGACAAAEEEALKRLRPVLDVEDLTATWLQISMLS